jgi:hypothetical protein
MNTSCDTCQNKSICRYVHDFSVLVDKVNKLDIQALAPFCVSLTCDKWRKIDVLNRNSLDTLSIPHKL